MNSRLLGLGVALLLVACRTGENDLSPVALADSAPAGTVLDPRDASGHRPVWVRLAPVAEPQTPQ